MMNDELGVEWKGEKLRGELMKVSGWVWKGWTRRTVEVERNMLRYFVKAEDESSKAEIVLDGCEVSLDLAPIALLPSHPYSFSLMARMVMPSKVYHFAVATSEERDKWIATLALASRRYRDMFYLSAARDRTSLAEFCHPMWEDRLPVFRSLQSSILDQMKSRLSFLDAAGYRRAVFQRDGCKVYYIISGGVVTLVVADSRLMEDTPNAACTDLRARFDALGATVDAAALKSFTLSLRGLLAAYSSSLEAIPIPEDIRESRAKILPATSKPLSERFDMFVEKSNRPY